MADSTVTMTGMAEARALVAALPAAVTAALKAQAIKTGDAVQSSARAHLLAQTKAEKTAAAIAVTVNDANKTVYVTSAGVAGDPANNPIWLEHGTIHEAPKPYMLPATKEHEAEYHEACEAATVAIAQGLAK